MKIKSIVLSLLLHVNASVHDPSQCESSGDGGATWALDGDCHVADWE